jgi:methylmalonyl-CoA carboxyltransferase large subunit
MTSDANDKRSMLEGLDALRREVARLGDRVAAVEAAVDIRPTAETAVKSQSPSVVDSASEDIISVISAAVAAYLGVRPHIRQISLVGGTSWAQQGRVTIQASHTFSIRHD